MVFLLVRSLCISAGRGGIAKSGARTRILRGTEVNKFSIAAMKDIAKEENTGHVVVKDRDH